MGDLLTMVTNHLLTGMIIKYFWNVNIPIWGRFHLNIVDLLRVVFLKCIKNSCAPKTWTQVLPLFSPIPHCISFLMDFVVVVATAGMVQAECPDFLFRTEVSHYNIYWKHEWQKSLVGAVGSINFLATACSGNCSLLNTSYEENWIHVFCRGCFFGCFQKERMLQKLKHQNRGTWSL